MVTFTGNAGDFLKIGVKAAELGQLEVVKEILQQRPFWVSKVGSHGRTMLWGACHKGRLEVVKYLLQQGADIRASGTHYTPYFVELSCLAIATYKGHTTIAEQLLRHGAFLDIHNAAFLGRLDLVQEQLRERPQRLHLGYPQHIMAPKHLKNVDFIPAPAPWATPFCYALRGGHLPTIQFLIQAGATVRAHSKELFIAADEDPDLVRLLLEHGADPKFAPRALPDDQALYQVISAFELPPPSPEELSADLVYLCRGDRGGNPKEAARLLDNGAAINFQDAKGKTALHRAAKAGFTTTIELLLQRGADVEVQDFNGETPVFAPIRSTIKDQQKRLLALQLLLQAGAKPAWQNHKGDTVIDILQRSKDQHTESLLTVLRERMG